MRSSRRFALLALAAAGAGRSAAQEDIVLRCGRVIDGRGGPPAAGTLVVRGDRLAAVGPGAAAPAGAREVDLRAMTCLPGLIDLHVHLAPIAAPWNYSSADKALLMAKNAREMLRIGFTTVRDVGEFDRYYAPISVRNAIARGDLEGPRMFVAPHPISATGGHADLNTLAPDLHLDVPNVVVNGPESLREALRQEFKYGADWIKLTLTGGVMSAGDNPRVNTFTEEELRAAVEETHRHGRRITVHAIGGEGVKLAARAGVDCIEHGILIDDEGIALMKEKGTWLVPTLYVLNYVIDEGPRVGYPVESINKGRALRAERDRRIRAAFAAGVKVAYGSDNIFPVKDSNKEFAELVKLGLTPMQAIRAATLSAAQVLGIESEVGTLEPGKAADVIAVPADPLADVRALEDVRFVMKGGRIVTGADRTIAAPPKTGGQDR